MVLPCLTTLHHRLASVRTCETSVRLRVSDGKRGTAALNHVYNMATLALTITEERKLKNVILVNSFLFKSSFAVMRHECAWISKQHLSACLVNKRKLLTHQATFCDAAGKVWNSQQLVEWKWGTAFRILIILFPLLFIATVTSPLLVGHKLFSSCVLDLALFLWLTDNWSCFHNSVAKRGPAIQGTPWQGGKT